MDKRSNFFASTSTSSVLSASAPLSYEEDEYAYDGYDENHVDSGEVNDEVIFKMFRAIDGLDDDENLQRKMEAEEILRQMGETDIEKVLRLNITKQTALKGMLKTIEQVLAKSDEELQAMKIQIKNGAFKFKPSPFIMHPMRRYGSPYFKDSDHFPAPPNWDAASKARQGEVDLAKLPLTIKWQQWEMKLLDEAVRKDAFLSLQRPLLAHKERLEEQLKREEDKGTSSRKTRRLIDEINEKLDELTGDPMFELIYEARPKLDWMKISATDFQGRRTPVECEAMWWGCLNLGVNRDPWTKQQLEKLRVIAEEHKFSDWEAIADEVGDGRTPFQCFLTLQLRLNRERAKWSAAEDKKMLTLVKKYRKGAYIPFSRIASELSGRTTEHVRQRWNTVLDPTIKKGPFTKREDTILTTARFFHKMTFRQISCLLPGRTPNQLRLRYTRIENMNPTIPWTPSENQRLLELVQLSHGRSWSAILKEFPERNLQQLRGRHQRLLKNQQGVARELSELDENGMGDVDRNARDNEEIQRHTIQYKRVAELKRPNVNALMKMVERRSRAGRRSKRRDQLDNEISQLFRSYSAQPKGRKKKYYSSLDVTQMAQEGRIMSDILGARYNWDSDQHLATLGTDVEAKSLLQIYHELRSLHQRDNWDSSSLTLTHLVPPTLTTLVSLRTLLLEQRFILQNSLGSNNSTCLPTPPETPILNASTPLQPPNSQAWPVTCHQNKETWLASTSAVSPSVPQPVGASTPQFPTSPPLHFITPPVPPLLNNPLSPSGSGNDSDNMMSALSYCDSEDSSCSFKSACDVASNISFQSFQSKHSAGQIKPLTNVMEESKEEGEEKNADNVMEEDCQQPELKEQQGMENALRLWQQRFLSVFFWPIIMSLQRPPEDLQVSLWEGEHMVCRDADPDESSDSDEGKKSKVRQRKDEDSAKKIEIMMSKIQRKQMLHTHWLETRELKRQERQERLARGEEEEAEDEEEPKEDLVERIPGKRGRPRRMRRRRRRRVDINLSDNN